MIKTDFEEINKARSRESLEFKVMVENEIN